MHTNVVSLFALVISVVSVCFTGAGWWISREKLRLELYNRRFDVYSRALDFYQVLLEWKPTGWETTGADLQDSEELRKTQRAFIKASREAQFLFEDASGVHKHLEQLHNDSIGIIGYKRDIAPKLAGQPDLASEYEKFTERWKRINNLFPQLEQAMSKYLNFHVL